MTVGSNTLLGYTFQGYMSTIAKIYAYKLSLKLASNKKYNDKSFEFHCEDKDINNNKRMDGNAYYDGKKILAMESKWTAYDPVQSAKTAIGQVYEHTDVNNDDIDVLVIVGSPSRNLKELDDSDINTINNTLNKKEKFWLDCSLRIESTGTAVFKFKSLGRNFTILFVALYSSRHDNILDKCDFGLGLALLIIKKLPIDHECEFYSRNDIIALGHSCFDDYIPQSPPSFDESKKKIIQKAPNIDKILLLDPWSYLIEKCLNDMYNAHHQKFRWIRILYDVLQHCANKTGNIEKLLPQRTIAAKIPPVIVNYGRKNGRSFIKEYEGSIQQAGTRNVKPVVQILSGIAGSGKSTLIEYLFENRMLNLRYGGSLSLEAGIPIFIDLQKSSSSLDDLKKIDQFNMQRTVTSVLSSLIVGSGYQNEKKQTYSKLDAILYRFNIHLYIDAFDQLSEESKELLNQLCVYMKELGYNISFILIATRPGYNELEALEWDAVIPEADTPTMDSINYLSPPDRGEYKKYVLGWLAELADLLSDSETTMGKASFRESLISEFHEWLTQSFDSGFNSHEDSDAIYASPLLSSMCLSLYMDHKLVSSMHEFTPESTSDIYHSMVERFWRTPHISTKEDGPNTRTSPNVLIIKELLDWFERVCYEALRDKNISVGQIPFDYMDRKWGCLTSGRYKNIPLGDNFFEAPFFKVEERNGLKYLEFVHPSFHEYFAASYITKVLCCKGMPGEDGTVVGIEDAVKLSVYRESVGKGTKEIVGTEFGRMLVSIGRDCFKYMIGLANHPEYCKQKHKSTPLETFDELLILDYGVQQYLYDTGYVDRAFKEISNAACKNGLVGFEKLLAHSFYGVASKLPHSIAYLIKITEKILNRIEPDALNIIDRWLAIFCLDHIDNRIDRVNSSSVIVQKLDDLENGSRFNKLSAHFKGTDIKKWCENKLKKTTNGLNVFSAIIQEEKQSITLENVPEPDIVKDFPFILRAAHYWGHIGNRELYYISSNHKSIKFSDSVKLKINKGLSAYSMAIVYRLCTIALTCKDIFAEYFSNDIFNAIELPSWFDEKINQFESVKYNMVDDLGERISAFERFVGPAQGIADTANQFSCRADLLLWDSLTHSDEGKQAKSIAIFEREYEVAEYLWGLSRRRDVYGAMGEGMLRYYFHMAGVRVRKSIVNDVIHKKPLRTKTEIVNEVQKELKKCEKSYGMKYELARTDSIKSSLAFLEFAKTM